MTRVKICGITNPGDALVAAEAGTDMLGFVFYPRSPRYVDPERAREIVAALKQASHVPRFVGVFVNEPLERVRAILESAQLDMAQLHGDESPEMVIELQQPSSPALVPQGEGSATLLAPRSGARGWGRGLIKALRPRDETEAQALVNEYRTSVNGSTPAFIVDAFDVHRFGGTGARADWDIAARIACEFPILLAGGLNANNVADAIRAVRPWGVDVSSGVERAPGLKDHDQMRQFIQAVKNLCAQSAGVSAVQRKQRKVNG